MRLHHFSSVILAITLTGYCSADNHNGATHPIAFMNITPDTTEEGFIQIYAVSPNISVVHVTSDTGLNEFKEVSSSFGTFYNSTKKFNELNTAAETVVGEHNENRLAVLLSASSDVHVYGVKSDKGTTDGFMSLPLTTDSIEFFVAAWNCTDGFFAALQIISAEAGTCMEIYKVDGDRYTLQQSEYLVESHTVYTFTAERNQDITGYFVNSSKPIKVVAGHSCAFIPEQVFFCDHIVEHIPPVSELGLTHIVPPIIGRLADAGYIVRVVSTDVSTTVTWMTANGATSGSQLVTRGHFIQIHNPIASQPMRVVCDKPCLVMLYNTGREATGNSDPVPTDPFMMFIVPVERFDTSSGFATANFCEFRGSVQYLIEFNNVVSIVTKTSDTGDILFDGQPVTRWSTAWGYSYAMFPVTHGMHVITLSTGSTATFGAYLYGHSLITSSSSGYGFTVGYQLKGTLLSKIWDDSQKLLEKMQSKVKSSECQQERIISGSAVAQHPAESASPRVLRHSIQLAVTVNSVPLTAACLERYRKALTADLVDLSRLINFLICNGSMCPDLTGSPGTGVRVNESSIISQHVVFAAIDTASLTSPISFDVDASTDSITTIHAKVPYTGILDTTVETFAKCRAEVREFLRQFVNWPRSTALLPTLDGCPQITFTAPFEFFQHQPVCTLSL